MIKPKFKTVKQPEGSFVCVAAVAAMAAATTLERAQGYIPSALDDEGHLYYKISDAVQFLTAVGIKSGLIFGSDEGLHCTDKTTLRTEWDFRGSPALLTVGSELYPGKFHFVLWDGKKVRDPNPGVPNTTKLSRYTIFDITPLHYEEEE